MTRKERLREQYEDALFALIMEEAAEAEGQKALEENRRLRDSGELAIPDGLRQRCHRAIAKGFAGQELRRVGRGVSRVVTKVALVALVGMLLLTTVFAASEDFRVKTLNLALEIFEDHTEITLTPDDSIANSAGNTAPQLTAGWLPDGFALVEEGENSAMAWKDFQNEEAGTQISITAWNLRTGGMNFDTEDAEMLPVQINGADAFIINDTEDEIIQIIWQEDAASEWLIYVVGKGVSEEMLMKTAESITTG